MFPQAQNGPTTGNQPPTSAFVQQNNSLLGNSPFQSNMATPAGISGLSNSTAPGSSTTDPNVMAMIKALKGAS